jgi:hypothetical protein
MDGIIPGSGSVSVAPLQAVVSSNSARTDCIEALISRWMVSINSDRMAQTVDLISAWLPSILAFISLVFASILALISAIIPFKSSWSLFSTGVCLFLHRFQHSFLFGRLRQFSVRLGVHFSQYFQYLLHCLFPLHGYTDVAVCGIQLSRVYGCVTASAAL